jgi:hypothetical protein
MFMRSVALGYGHYFLWHLPSLVLGLVSACTLLVVLRQIVWSAYGPAARSFRWSIVGWCAVALSFASAITVPYLRSAAHLSVAPDGTWVLRNYLYVPIAVIRADEVRELRVKNMGGQRFGTGNVEIRREDGSVVRSVRIDRERLASVLNLLGYHRDDLVQQYADLVVCSHRVSDRHAQLAANPW